MDVKKWAQFGACGIMAILFTLSIVSLVGLIMGTIFGNVGWLLISGSLAIIVIGSCIGLFRLAKGLPPQ
jgi:hypothetical protein